MHFYNYIFMCLYIGVYIGYQLMNAPFPGFLRTLNIWVCWGFLLWGAYWAGKVILDCILLSMKNQMSSANAISGVMLAVLNFLPGLLISVFMLKEGFK